MFRYETHLHTAEGSGCASASGAEQARRYKALGYDGIIVTDHFFNGNCAVTNFDSWEDRVNKFCKGYENAKEEGDRIGLKVFFRSGVFLLRCRPFDLWYRQGLSSCQ